ncbi:ABC transporter ATP-binding protein [Halalkalibaculum sp. DA3122]|uniref:ABC transporter ATP-binding protein n=1 Tax=unclassified Halalkalibaculum TaxID=2964617 RepID=UPI0037542173
MVNPLRAEHITKSFGDEQVLINLNMELQEYETLSILGRSGCGKTTLLKILAGLESPDQGSVWVGEKNIQSLSSSQRDIVYLYQEALLFPHINVFENIAFGLRLRKMDEKTVTKRTNKMINQLELNGMQDKMPHQLSGGQQQRVSFGRALITDPKVILLDEPFGSLDADTRSSMQNLFKRVADQINITAIFVTHNVKEAILMGDRIAKLDNGNLKMFDSIEAFVQSGENSVKEEIDFWQTISDKQ